jgi:DNA-binding transcriptional ArsR family regulator
MTVHTKKFHLEERRRQVASLLAQSMTEQEIADKLGVDRSTISRDIKTLSCPSSGILDLTSHFTHLASRIFNVYVRVREFTILFIYPAPLPFACTAVL